MFCVLLYKISVCLLLTLYCKYTIIFYSPTRSDRKYSNPLIFYANSALLFVMSLFLTYKNPAAPREYSGSIKAVTAKKAMFKKTAASKLLL